MALFQCKLTPFHSKVDAFMLYHRPRSQPLELKLYRGLSSLDSLQHNSSKLGHELRLVTPSRKLKQPHALIITSEHLQNSDFPRTYSRKEKKPFPVPVLELRRAARQRFKNMKGKPKGKVGPPKNGLVVRSLIPLAYDVLNARTQLINNLKKLMKVVPVHACAVMKSTWDL